MSPPAKRRQGLSRSALPLLILVLLLAGPTAAEEFSFERLDRTYQAFVQDLAPIEIGSARVGLRSPDHELTLFRHRAVLRPDPAGGYRVDLELELEGRGHIEADVELGAMRSHLADDLAIPRQRLQVTGRASVQRAEDGYHITTLELPESVTVAIRSRLAGQLVSLCRPMAFVLVSLRCDTLEGALSQVTVPLPAPGQTYLLALDELSEVERDRFDRFLAEVPATPPH